LTIFKNTDSPNYIRKSEVTLTNKMNNIDIKSGPSVVSVSSLQSRDKFKKENQNDSSNYLNRVSFQNKITF
jgi:hypothetical protein